MRSNIHQIIRTAGFLYALLAAFCVPAMRAQFSTTIGPDAAGYSATNATAYGFVDIASTGTSVLRGADDDAALVNLGFPFSFYSHNPYSDVCISSNGLLTFGGCNNDFANQDLTALPTAGDHPSIAPLWTDLTFNAPGAGAVYYQLMGTAPNRSFIVQWSNVFPVNAPRPVTFQVMLREATNSIVFQYQNVDLGAGSPATLGGTATVGIRDSGGHASGRRLQWSYAVPVLRNQEAIVFISEVRVTMDIAPDDPTNGINPKNKGLIPVAILGTADFNAQSVDVTTVRFGPQGTEAAPAKSSLQDVNRDKIMDMVLQFPTAQSAITCATISAQITGRTLSGVAFRASDAVRPVGCK